MDKKKLIDDLVSNIYCRLAPSSINNVGVFAIRDIPKGINPFMGLRNIDNEDWIDISEKEIFSNSDISESVKEMVSDFYATQNGVISFPPQGLNEINISYFLNHSENPNVKREDDGEFTALRDIKTGEELTQNYEVYGGV